MEIFRISAANYAKALTSSGSSNRWNEAGQKVIYAGSSRSLATLELIVHESAVKPEIDYKVMVISIADDDTLFETIVQKQLPKNWRFLDAYAELQKIGSDWYIAQRSLVLKVPSAIVPKEYNYVINTLHPDFGTMISLVRQEDYFWDPRLLN